VLNHSGAGAADVLRVLLRGPGSDNGVDRRLTVYSTGHPGQNDVVHACGFVRYTTTADVQARVFSTADKVLKTGSQYAIFMVHPEA
jgi:hypothetical protein